MPAGSSFYATTRKINRKCHQKNKKVWLFFIMLKQEDLRDDVELRQCRLNTKQNKKGLNKIFTYHDNTYAQRQEKYKEMGWYCDICKCWVGGGRELLNNTLNDSRCELMWHCENRAIDIGHHHHPLKRETNKCNEMCQENKKM